MLVLVDFMIPIICLILYKYNNNKIYILLGIGIFCGIVSAVYSLWDYSAYLCKISIFIYIWFILKIER